ncbi:dTMP kinase [Streptomyces hesseae]|uniref:Thymidylate kinase n=1 Tax=Streptomyces hesseae TaxID=3075519 RepID=A0ABU2SY24_9ACTN|nr:thymidylate kinase [Streptomyces sp. DSM 40473]MDT0453757.1 thymidylate kinase [Streptomyces sp. DSM 40473]
MNVFPFIVVEGLDGSGKTTLRKGLFRLFEHLYGVTPLAVLTTNWLAPEAAPDLVEGKYRPAPENRDRYLAALRADKQASVTRLIVPSLAARPVIADRWLISELAFFAVKHDQPPMETYAKLADAIDVTPSLTIVLETATEQSMARAAGRTGGEDVRKDWDVIDVQARVREAIAEILSCPSAFPKIGPTARIDASQERAAVLRDAWDALAGHNLTPALPMEEV